MAVDFWVVFLEILNRLEFNVLIVKRIYGCFSRRCPSHGLGIDSIDCIVQIGDFHFISKAMVIFDRALFRDDDQLGIVLHDVPVYGIGFGWLRLYASHFEFYFSSFIYQITNRPLF